MKPCADRIPALVDAAEGHPDAETRAHLAGCEGCRREHDALREGLARLAPPPVPEPGPWLAARVRRAAESRRARGRRLWFAAPALAATAVVAMLVLPSAPPVEPAQLDEALVADLAPELVPPVVPDRTMESAGELSELGASVLGLGAADDDLIDETLGTWEADLTTLLAEADDTELAALLESLPG